MRGEKTYIEKIVEQNKAFTLISDKLAERN